MYYKLGQACVTNWVSFVLLQIRAKVVSNCGSFIIINWGKCCYKLGQLLQIRATIITKQGSYYNVRQNVLQFGEGITNQGNYYKLGHNNICLTKKCFDGDVNLYPRNKYYRSINNINNINQYETFSDVVLIMMTSLKLRKHNT